MTFAVRCKRWLTGTGAMVPGAGFEPATFGLQNRCTTAVLTRPSRGFPALAYISAAIGGAIQCWRGCGKPIGRKDAVLLSASPSLRDSYSMPRWHKGVPDSASQPAAWRHAAMVWLHRASGGRVEPW